VRRVLVDTGPLVAILSKSDEHHQECIQMLHSLPGPLFTCWPVITEAVWLLRKFPTAIDKLLKSLHSGFLEVMPLASLEAEGIAKLMTRYANLRPQLADATLVYLAGRDNIHTVFTLDRRDFSVYRGPRNRAFKLLP